MQIAVAELQAGQRSGLGPKLRILVVMHDRAHLAIDSENLQLACKFNSNS